MSEKSTYLIKIDTEYKNKIKYLARRLRRKNFVIKETLKALGVIIADAPLDFRLDEFKMRGIKYLEKDRQVKKAITKTLDDIRY